MRDFQICFAKKGLTFKKISISEGKSFFVRFSCIFCCQGNVKESNPKILKELHPSLHLEKNGYKDLPKWTFHKLMVTTIQDFVEKLRRYFLGVLAHTTACDRLWGGDENM